jgi:simple sugar transport system permease protein
MNLLSVGLTTFLLQAMLGAQGMIRPANIQKIPNMELDFLENIPFIGSVLHNQSFIVPLAIFMAIALHFVIKKTVYGMNVVSLGESEGAARSAGISVKKVQWSVILLSGLFSGLAGAYLSSVILSEFSMNMVQGRGFTAYTAVIFGNTNAILVWLVTLLFGWAEAIGVQLELAGIGVPSSILKMFPYVLAIIVLIISSVNTKRRKERKK